MGSRHTENIIQKSVPNSLLLRTTFPVPPK
jgi:hypothetical protein